jgi:hypothetical protein
MAGRRQDHGTRMTVSPEPGFFNLYRQGFARCAVAAPHMRLARPAENAAAIAALAREAEAAEAAVLLTPELSVTGYAIDDLHHQDALLDAGGGGPCGAGAGDRRARHRPAGRRAAPRRMACCSTAP